jgi:hypothetical protein
MEIRHAQHTDTEAAVLRGALPAGPLGARGLAQLATSTCRRETAILAVGLTPDQVAAAWGLPDRPGISPFAAETGRRFEHTLLANSAARLIDLYQAAGRLPGSPTVLDLTAVPATPEALSEATATTRRLVAARAAGRDAPEVIIQGRLPIPVGDTTQVIQPDLLVAEPDQAGTYRVVEIKAHRDRGGHTDPTTVAAAALQLAAGTLALAAADAPTTPMGDLVLRAAQPPGASLHPLDITGELRALATRLGSLRTEVEHAHTAADGPLSDQAAARRIPHTYLNACWGRCALAPTCARQAHEAGSITVVSATASITLPGLDGVMDAVAVAAGTNPSDLGPGIDALRAGWAAGDRTWERDH